ncbi:MAG: hypothetical protein NTZ48_05815 [Candidatus Omnitrophica bacterium]|nr:hypothetical protein [Candidatus Omnitrophota bacterium]
MAIENQETERNEIIGHTYSGPEDYKAELSVTDNSGAVVKKSLNLKILPSPPPKNTGKQS